jgi:NodT family efflux transporter outer membrane factor (OMF) lipoprotein
VRAGLVLLAAASSGCGGWLHSVEREPDPPVTLGDAWRTGTSTASPTTEGWWRQFEDPRLQQVVETALERNLDLVQAMARLRQAEAAVKGARAGLFPTITGDASGGRSKTVINFGQGPVGFSQDQFSLSAGASYELDLWGRVARGLGAARRDRAAARADAQTAAMTLSARTVDTYLQLIEQRATLDLLEQQIESSETFLELVEFRFDQGVSSGLDVFQQREQVARTRALLPPVRARIAQIEHQLSVLMGQAPAAQTSARRLPAPPPLPSTGVPSEILQQRPDVRAAQERLVAQDHRIGVAIAERFPRVSLSASTGFRAFELADLFQQFVWSLSSAVSATVFDGGRLSAEVRRQRARYDELLAAYGQSMLVALREVEDALAQEAQQRRLVEDLGAQLDASEATLQEARLRYGNGLSDYLPVLTALTGKQNTQRALIGARRQLLSFRVELYRALGGTWEATEPSAGEAS